MICQGCATARPEGAPVEGQSEALGNESEALWIQLERVEDRSDVCTVEMELTPDAESFALGSILGRRGLVSAHRHCPAIGLEDSVEWLVARASSSEVSPEISIADRQGVLEWWRVGDCVIGVERVEAVDGRRGDRGGNGAGSGAGADRRDRGGESGPAECTFQLMRGPLLYRGEWGRGTG